MKQLMKTNKEGIMQIPNKNKVDFGEMIIRENLFRKGIDPKTITNEQQLDNILNTPTVSPKPMPKKSGEVIDVDFGKPIDPEDMADGGVAGLLGERTGFRGGYLASGAKELGKKYKGSTLEALLENPKLLGTELSYEGIMALMKLLPSLFADGGPARQNFAMGRRAFLKLMGGVGAGIGALKTGALKFLGKEGAKNIPQVVTTPPTPGKPAWFDKLVNKVILEGDDITKKFATKEREIVHIKKIDKDNTVTVTQDLDEGIVRVEYDSPTNMYEDTVQLQYKKPLPDKFNPNPKAEFSTAESGPVGKSVGPDDYDIEVDEIGGASIEDLSSDVSKLKEFATGKKPTMKEIIQNKKRKDKAKAITNDPEAQSDAVVKRQGEALDYDDYAAGGIARMLGE